MQVLCSNKTSVIAQSNLRQKDNNSIDCGSWWVYGADVLDSPELEYAGDRSSMSRVALVVAARAATSFAV